eukprot:gene17266-18990_t
MALKRNPDALRPLRVEVKGQDQWEDLMTKEGLIVVDAYASWCGPCKAIESTFRKMRNETGDDLLHFATAETDSIESLALYRERSRPTFLFYGGGQLMNAIRGCNAPLLIRSITELLKEEHKILDGESDRKPFVDTEVQKEEAISSEEKQDQQKDAEGEEDDEDTVIVEVPKEISVVIIKPDALRSGHADKIIESLEDSGFEVLEKEEKILTKEEVAEFYKQHEGSDRFEQLIDFMSSGPVLSLVLSKKGDDAGYGLIPELRDMIGPTDVNIAKEEAPDSIRAQYGTDSIMNAVHACDSGESAARELAFFFPDFNVPKVHEKQKKKRIQRTLALVRPAAYMKRKDSIISKIEESGFTIAMSKEMQLTREQAEEFYAEHKGEDYFESLINNMTSGPSLALCLAREDAVEAWRNLLGPKDVTQAKEVEPESLRAVFAEEGESINPLHGAASVVEAEKELNTFFPVQSTVAVIKPEVYSIPDQREEILENIRQAGFKISAQKEINLTKDLASQFYKEHEGKEFFDGLTDYMSSGPTLFMILSKEDAIPGFRALVGPTDPEKAKEEAPTSLRAMYATDPMKNAIHSSSNVEKATEVIHEFFPEVELNPDGTVKEEDKAAKDSERVEEDAANAKEETAAEEGEQVEDALADGSGEQMEGAADESQQKETEDGASEETSNDVNNNPNEDAKQDDKEATGEHAEEADTENEKPPQTTENENANENQQQDETEGDNQTKTTESKDSSSNNTEEANNETQPTNGESETKEDAVDGSKEANQNGDENGDAPQDEGAAQEQSAANDQSKETTGEVAEGEKTEGEVAE